MMTSKKVHLGLFLAALLVFCSSSFAAYSVLDRPAVMSDLAPTSLVYTVKKEGDRYFATGIRGHILYSDDKGETWQQAEVPVRASITSIDMVDSNTQVGWAVGHSGVILHTKDGGQTWEKQYDGTRYGPDGYEYFSKLLENDPENETLAILVDEMDFAMTQGADKPFFALKAHDENYAHAFGAYGMFMVTSDGGKTWLPHSETVDNFAFNHLFDYAQIDEHTFFICGEVGVTLLGSTVTNTTVAVNSPWEGSFFTCEKTPSGEIFMGGLRGQAFLTGDEAATWHPVEKPETGSIVDSITLSDGRFLILVQNGQLLVSSDNGHSFKLVKEGLGQSSSVAEVDPNTVLVASFRGIQKVSLAE